jgi:hypothetical protein
MIPFQLHLEAWLRSFRGVGAFMQMTWSWPLAESAHFIGLTMLFGSIAAWDLRLLGMLRDVPALAFHRLIPFAVAGFVVNIATGVLFLMTYPDQYVYNAAFYLKMLCILLAGVNVAMFYMTMFGRVDALGPGVPPPLLARLNGGVSLLLWTTVIIAGRMITFFRPAQCDAAELATMLIADCLTR